MAIVLGRQTLDQLNRDDRELYDRAQAISANAYLLDPVHGLRVGAAARTTGSSVYEGCNVENDSYGLTCCAERNAIFAAVTAEGPQMRLQALAVYAGAHMPSPCGACRQVMAQFGLDARVIFPLGEDVLVTTVGELLPHPFRLDE